MTDKQPPGLFFCGTGTEVGKTYAAASCAAALHRRGVRVGVYKPVASGCEIDDRGEPQSEDALALQSAIGGRLTLSTICPQRFRAPLAPPTAAAEEGASVDERELTTGFDRVARSSDLTLVEGAGGLMSPLSDSMTNLDLAIRLDLPLVLVAGNRLGVINDCLLCWTVITRCSPLPLRAIILSSCSAAGDGDPSSSSNLRDLQSWLPDVPVIDLPYRAAISAAAVDVMLPPGTAG